MSIDGFNELRSSYRSLVDAQASQETFISWYDTVDFSDHKEKKSWALWLACADGNHRLVTHIITHADKGIVNQLVCQEHVLLRALTLQKPWGSENKSCEQAEACAQILIDAGANVNADHDRGNSFNILSNFSLLGKMVLQVFESRHDRQKQKALVENDSILFDNESKVRFEKDKIRQAAFLLANGAKCQMQNLGELTENSELNSDDRIRGSGDEDLYGDGESDLPTRGDLLKIFEEIQSEAQKVIFNKNWPQTRMFYLAQKGNVSAFASMPEDIIRLVGKMVIEESCA